MALLMGSVAARAEICGDPERFADLRAEALSLEHGEGVQRNVERATQLYCEGARLGDAEAQYRLGWIYANGRGVQRDDALASYFFALAARQGNAEAERMLRHVGAEAAPVPPCMMVEERSEADEEEIAFENLTPAQQKVIELVRKLAPQFGVSPRLAMAVIRAESNFDPLAVSNKNAQGLMQLIPDTAVRFNVKKPFDPEQNVRGGLAYLRWLLAYFKGNVALVAAAYNAGEGAVNHFRGIPPFAETRGYVKRIRELFTGDDHPYDSSVVDPSPELPRIRVRSM
jgi:TPR repeat protein